MSDTIRVIDPEGSSDLDAAVQIAGARTPGSGISTIEAAIEAIRRGEMVIVVDDADRENEGDFVMAADWVTPEAVNFMVTHGRGLLCLPLTGDRLEELEIAPMVPEAGGLDHTAFTVSIDINERGNTGISALDRARCIRRAVSADAAPSDFRRPGHVFPLRAVEGGVLKRPGHTEASVDLARLAGLSAAGVICEIMNPDGTMARLDDLLRVADRFGLHLVTIADLIAYRRRSEKLVRRVAEAVIPTPHGPFTAIAYQADHEAEQHIALVRGTPNGDHPVLVRMHSECLTGDVFASLRCDCGVQLDDALRRIAEEGEGVVVYMRGHEGRSIGIVHKLQAYKLQDGGFDTVEANIELGFPVDARDYGTGAQILVDLGLTKLRLLTNNPQKRAALEGYGLEVVERIGLETVPTVHNLRYLQTKRDKMGHEIQLETVATETA